jgi:preprotein translocase subunit SecA
MYFNQFKSKLNGHGIQSHLYSYGHLIEQTEDSVLIDGASTEFTSLEEAREYIKQNNISEKLEQEISKELYEEIDDSTIASMIKEHHDIKVTDTIIESYLNLASAKEFTFDPVVTEIRNLNKLDKIFEGKIDFILNDGSIVAINEDTFEQINNIFENHSDVIRFMRESKQNFVNVIEQIEG